MATTGRLVQFDIMKGIGILLVLLGHTEIPDALKVQIYAFHMPLFFFCSGVFYKDRALKETFSRCIRQLLIPWLFFVAVRYLCLLVLYVKAGNYSEYVREVLLTTNLLDEQSQIYVSIWFFIGLFLVRMLYAFIDTLAKKVTPKYDALLTGILTGGGYFAALYLRLPLFIDTAIGVLAYYHLGRVFYRTDVYKKTLSWAWIIALAAGFVVSVALLHPHVELKECKYPIYHILLAMLGIYTVYQVSVKVGNESAPARWLSHCGKSSLSLLGFHRPLWLFVYPACIALHLSGWATVAVQLITALLIILPGDGFLRKHAPILIGTK